MRRLSLAALALATSSGLALAAPQPQSGWHQRADEHDPLGLAHARYLEGDLSGMIREAHAALVAHGADRAAQANLAALLDRAQADQPGRALPADWRVPPEIGGLKLAVRRTYQPHKDLARFTLSLSGQELSPGALENLQLLRHPAETFLDRSAGLGDWEAARDAGGRSAFSLTTAALDAAPPEGLYLIRIKIRGRPWSQGWAVLTRAAASEAPSVDAPGFNQAYRGGAPAFAWQDFRSPEYREGEERRVSALVRDARDGAGGATGALWAQHALPPSRGGTSASRLRRGNYTFELVFQERRRFGDLVVSRESATTVPFSQRD